MNQEESKFYELSEDVIERVNNVIKNLALPFNVKIKYIGHSKLKKVIQLKKASDELAYINNLDLIIYINEDYLNKLEEKNSDILIYQELDRIVFDIEKGKFKISKFPLQTTTGVLKKYGIEAVAEANELSELIQKQKEDTDKDLETFKPKKKKDVEFMR